ncbi:questin oxidase family protein [Streptomyces desertarenae]|uniref:Questin oxidase family protein n=1 Tax=Streptomyces desertarenae TaxID=2666184 RepID=A0ABW4PV14_9ACTN
MTTDTSGTLDEALERLHTAGPEFDGWLSNHGPMAVEALVRHGRSHRVHHWLDHYRARLDDMPSPYAPVTAENWREALGDPRRLADWTLHFRRELAEHPWRTVLARWWPRLLPGIAGGATHPVIRVGHAVRTLLADEDGAGRGGAAPGGGSPRLAELAHALGYWAARHQPLPRLARSTAPGPAGEALDAVAPVPDQSGGIRTRLAQLTSLPDWPDAAALTGPEDVRGALAEVVRAATHRYGSHAHGEPVMLVHAATAPNAVLRTLPALPRELWEPSLAAAWSAAAAVTAAYTPRDPLPPARRREADAEEVFERAAAHGDEHAIKFADTALDVASWGDDGRALDAALRSVELIPPLR